MQPLLYHPSTPPPANYDMQIGISRSTADALTLRFILEGDISRIRIPDAHRPQRAERLWEHTCFEAFLTTAQGQGYREFNFSPSGDWATFDFSDYRCRKKDADISITPETSVCFAENHLEFVAVIAYENCQDFFEKPIIGLSAVIENSDASLTYWALRHPVARPDFHHRDAFIAMETLDTAG